MRKTGPEKRAHHARLGVQGRFCAVTVALLFSSLLSLGCRQDMHDQPRFEPFEKNTFFADGRSVRPHVPGTVARGQLNEDRHLHTGWTGDELAETFPFPMTRREIERGRERFDIMCSPCHGRVGNGNGIVVERGFRRPPSYHIDRLREAPVGHFFDVMTQGFGAMGDFTDRMSPRDRWCVVAYIRALQLSQETKLDELPARVREEFRGIVSGSPAASGD